MIKKTVIRITILASIFIFLLIGGLTYQLYSKKVVTLAPELKEISGIEMDKAENFWAINYVSVRS
jgi:hypothetical protein